MRDRITRTLERVSEWVEKHRLLTVVAVAVLISAPGYWRQEQAIDRAEHAIQQVEEARANGRVLACEGDRTFAMGHNNLILYLTHIPGRPAPDAEVAAAFEKANLVPVRDCSPEGIAKFYGEDVGETP